MVVMPQFDDLRQQNKLAELYKQEEENLVRTIASRQGYQYVNLNGISLNLAALQLIAEAKAKAGLLVGFKLNGKKLSVAMRNPNNQVGQEVLKKLKADGYIVSVHLCSMTSLEHIWIRYQEISVSKVVKKGVLDLNPDEINWLAGRLASLEKVREHIIGIWGLNNARRVSETLEAIFAGAEALKASDIHIEPEETAIRLRYRLDGVLHDVVDLEKVIYERLLSRLKLLSGLILNVRNRAQDGRFTFDLGEKEIEIRSSVIPGSAGESMVMRLLDPSVAGFSMDQLGLNPRLSAVMAREIKRPNGLIITTGPTGSGKTTALYAFLRAVHTKAVKIITIEDPVEYKINNIVQTQVGDKYSFASGLRSILRQDPDIIMIGEIRDGEVAKTAIHAAQTGHLVFSTLHTNSAVGAFPRLLDLGVDYRLFGNAINVILGQRLVRKLCPACKVWRQATALETETITGIAKEHPDPPTLNTPLKVCDAVGCAKCSGGFKGRQGLFEAVLLDTATQATLIESFTEQSILAATRPQKIPTMRQDGVTKILAGIISFAELERVVDLYHTDDATPETRTEDDDFAAHIV